MQIKFRRELQALNWRFVKPDDILYSAIAAAPDTAADATACDTHYRYHFNRLWKRLNVT
jgi:hypothetical protein